MTTQKQQVANRKNAKKSTGPRTDAGKQTVALNGVTHGATAQTLILPGEAVDDFKALLTAIVEEYHITTPTGYLLARKLAVAAWKTLRLERYEQRDTNDALMLFYLKPPLSDTILRHTAHVDRQFYKALAELQKLAGAEKNG